MAILFEKLDPENLATRAAIFAFVTPHEPHGLFLLGNLNSHFPGTSLYLLREGARWLALGAHYDGPRSVIAFAPPGTAADRLRHLTREIIARHPEFDWTLGPEFMARPVLDELLANGYQVVNDPRQVFMEMHGLPPLQPNEGLVRLARHDHAEELDAIARLQRLLRGGQDDRSPVTERERSNTVANNIRMVFERDGRILAMAASNGVGVTVCQVLGVATAVDARRQGLAGATVVALMRHMATLGAQHTALFTRHDNTPAIRCYQRLGFAITGDFLLANLRPPTPRA